MREINQINNDISLIQLLFGVKTKQSVQTRTAKQSTGLDTVTISNEARQIVNATKVSGNSVNTNLDNSIDLQSYIDAAEKENQEATETSCDSIKAYNGRSSEVRACRAALNDKYSKLVETAKQHSNPSEYIYEKYYNSGCFWYESDLSYNERQIAYRYEMSVLNTGEVSGMNMGDSLFRNVKESQIPTNDSEISFNRSMINAQISNILKNNNIQLSIDTSLSYSVDPYSYYITVSCDDDTLSSQVEQALNVGENGKNLYRHIKTCASQDGADSTQISDDSLEKFYLYHQVEEYTGIDIRTLTEKDGSYYTEDGSNIIDLVNEKIDEVGNIPISIRSDYKKWIEEMVTKIASIGWNNIEDMNLEINYTNGKLIDQYQNIQYSN